MEVRIVTEKDFPAWEAYLLADNRATFFHRIGWLTVVQETYGHKPFYLIATRGGKVCGVLPLFLVSSPIFGRVLASDVFTSYGGVCADKKDVEIAIMKEAARLAAQNRVSYLEIKNIDKVNVPGNDWSTKNDYCTMLLDLEPGAEGIWKHWQGKIRRNVRKAEKSGVTIEQGSHLLDSFYEVIALNMKRLGTPVHSKNLYRNMLKEFPGDVALFVAKVSGESIGAAVAVGFKDQCQLFLSASDSSHWHLKPNDLLYWAVIQHACERGYRYLDFGRSTWHSGTFDFKKHMGATPRPLYYEYFLNRARSVPHVSQDNKKYQLAIQAWRCLPLGVTKIVGPRLIKYIV